MPSDHSLPGKGPPPSDKAGCASRGCETLACCADAMLARVIKD